MKKLVATVLTVGALAGGTAAHAGLFNDFLNMFGPPPNATVHVDAYGRQFFYDQYGQVVYMNSRAAPAVVAPAPAQTIIGYDAWNRPIYGSTTYSYNNYAYVDRSWDRDGDGVSNYNDRWPDDGRYR